MQGTGTAAVIVLPKVSTVISVFVGNDYNIPKSEFVFLKRTFSITYSVLRTYDVVGKFTSFDQTYPLHYF